MKTFLLIVGLVSGSIFFAYGTGCGEGFSCCPPLQGHALISVACNPDGTIEACQYKQCSATFDDPIDPGVCDVGSGAWWAECDPFAY